MRTRIIRPTQTIVDGDNPGSDGVFFGSWRMWFFPGTLAAFDARACAYRIEYDDTTTTTRRSSIGARRGRSSNEAILTVRD